MSVISTRVVAHVEVRIRERYIVVTLAQHHVSLARLHVLQASAPLSAVARLCEVGKLRVTLYHVAWLCIVVVVAQCRLYAQVHGRSISYAVPSLLHINGALILVHDHGTLYRQCAILMNHDSVSALR